MSLTLLLPKLLMLGALDTGSSGLDSKWNRSTKKEDLLLIDPTAYLSSKQKKLIYSGFPAYSILKLVVDGKDSETVIKTQECAIKYDLWDEKFEFLLGEKEKKTSLKSSQEYFDKCLVIKLKDSPQVQTLLKSSLEIRLDVSFTQISGKNNSAITSWLIQQQSKVLKGLFSHMLGELKLTETASFKVDLQSQNQEDKS